MDASSRILSELASRERALDAKVEAAHAAARQQLEAAEVQAAQIVKSAQERVSAMTAEHERGVAGEVEGIRSQAQGTAGAQARATRERAEGKLQQAVETIMRAVLP